MPGVFVNSDLASTLGAAEVFFLKTVLPTPYFPYSAAVLSVFYKWHIC